MFLTRKRIIRNLIVLIIFALGLFALLHILTSADDYQDNQEKIRIIEESIQSYENHGECKIPDLPIDNPEIMKFYINTSKIDCGNPDDDWVICEKSKCFVKPTVLAAKGHIQCSYTDLLRKSDYSVKYGKTTKTNDFYILNKSDFAKVYCKTEDGERWYGMAIGIRDSIPSSHSNNHLEKQQPINILMFGFDSLSRNAFIRKLPKTYNYLVNALDAIVLKGYNIVGDGTPQALIPILTGQTELELPETRKRFKGSQFVDVYPLIWKNYKQNGYVTSFNEDIPNYGTFTYRLNGFEEQPTDHYMRTYYIEVQNFLSSSKQFCIGHQPGHKMMLDYTKNFMLKYSKTPKFVFSFHGELSHDSINLIEAADEDVVEWIKDLQNAGSLNNTILIMMSDHGNRFAEVRNTLQGKQEERLPFFSFTFPKWFQAKFPNEYNNFRTNINRLTTPFDINETLKDILRLQNLHISDDDVQHQKETQNNYDEINTTKKSLKKKNLKKTRAISLFKEISKNRSCADAYIEPHWCACLQWQPINNTNSNFVQNLARTVLNEINLATESKRSLCSKLELLEINWALKLKPHNNLLKFKQNKDLDGFLADLTSETIVQSEIYQIKLTTIPGKSIFEASVHYNLKTKNMSVILQDISRINKYGNQANCIYHVDPELRKYCYCKFNESEAMF